jgi:hypothetical protein
MNEQPSIIQPTPAEYLERTSSATQKLFTGINDYHLILSKNIQAVVYTGNPRGYEAWERDNAEEIRRTHEQNRKATREFIAEEHALSVLCGAVLQVALKVLELRTETYPSVEIAEEFDAIKSKATLQRFYIGRHVRGLPIGIIIYAGRNQHVHFEDKALHDISRIVFQMLAKNFALDLPFKIVSTSNIDTSDERFDPAFDLNKRQLYSYAANITYLLGWRDYETYEEDMLTLIRG